MLSGLEYLPGLGKSDHVVLRFGLNCYTTWSVSEIKRLNFHRANFSQLSSMIGDIDWQCLTLLDLEAAYTYFKESLAKVVADCIPTVRGPQSKKNIYMNSHALRLKRRKNQLWHRYLQSQEPLDLARFRTCRNRLRSLTGKLRQEFDSRLVADLKEITHLRHFFKSIVNNFHITVFHSLFRNTYYFPN